MASALGCRPFASVSGRHTPLPFVEESFHACSENIINLQSDAETYWRLHGKPALETVIQKVYG